MKQINDLKKIFGKNSELEKVMNDIKETSGKLNEAKKKGDGCHKELKKLRKKGDYGSFRELSKEITDLRKKHNEIYNQFVEAKKEYLGENNKLKEELKQMKQKKKKEKVKNL